VIDDERMMLLCDFLWPGVVKICALKPFVCYHKRHAAHKKSGPLVPKGASVVEQVEEETEMKLASPLPRGKLNVLVMWW